MTGLNSLRRSLTGPRCLRSVLRAKTTPIYCLLDSLAGPTELRVSIPASVFGGDIFGVMSQHLREALICPPPPPASVPRTPGRKRLLRSAENSAFQNPANVFPPPTFTAKYSTLPGASLDFSLREPEAWASGNGDLTEVSDTSGILQSNPTRQARRRLHENQRLQENQRSGRLQENLRLQANRTLHPEPALVNSLKRYWELISERHETSRLQLPPSLTEVLPGAANFPVSESDQRTTSHAWPVLAGAAVADKLRAFSAGSHPSLKPAQFNPTHDHQIQNVFNIEVKNANPLAPDYDDLGDRIAQILAEQALQHGIDIT